MKVRLISSFMQNYQYVIDAKGDSVMMYWILYYYAYDPIAVLP